MTRKTVGWGIVGLLVAVIVGYLEFDWNKHRMPVHVGAYVIVLGTAENCEVRIPPARSGTQMPCRNVADYLQSGEKVPARSVFVVIEYTKLPREVTDAVAAPLKARGYEFGLVAGPELMSAGSAGVDDHPVQQK